MRSFARHLVALAPLIVLACTAPTGESSVSATAEDPPAAPGRDVGAAPAPTPDHDHANDHETWRKLMARSPMPKAGCFRASYPGPWEEVACAAKSTIPPQPAGGEPARPATLEPELALHPQASPSVPRSSTGPTLLPELVGNGTDWQASVPSGGAMSWAQGSFPSVYFANDQSDVAAFSLQLNTNTFTTPRCNGSGCKGWQQFLYTGQSGNTDALQVYIQYWFLNYSGGCPTGFSQQTGTSNCFANGNASSVGVPLSDLHQMKLTGQQSVVVDGDESVVAQGVVLTDGDNLYGSSDDDQNTLSLNGGTKAEQWTTAEFNVFGPDNSRNIQISGNANVTVAVETSQSTSFYPFSITPGSDTCQGGGTTGETNSMTKVPNCCVATANGITFMESNDGESCTLCGAQGQQCCSPNAVQCASSSDVCYGGTCVACGGSGEICCANSTCGSGLACQAGYCGAPNALSASPASISAAAADGAGLSVNYATTELTLTGAWAGSNAGPSLSYSGLPAGVSCSPTTGLPADEGPTRVTCTTSYYTPLSPPNSPYPIVITADESPYNPLSTTVDLTVTACQPLTCGDIGYTCGNLDDGCGDTVSCGTCPSGDSCVAGVCAPTCNKYCPPPEYLDPYTCTCDSCKCGEIIVGGHRICAICKP